MCTDSANDFKKNELKPHLRKCWCIPPEKNAECVACMEDILDLYCLPYDPEIPRINMDEQPVQLIKETVEPLPIEPGQVQRYDYKLEFGKFQVENLNFTICCAGI